MIRWLKVELLSETTFASDRNGSLYVDVDVATDDDGFPVIQARTLKGLLVESCASLLHVNKETEHAEANRAAASLLFGDRVRRTAEVEWSDARLAGGVRRAFASKKLTKIQRLDVFTTIRSQTAIDREVGVAKENTLRTVRVLVPGLIFLTEIGWRLSQAGHKRQEDLQALLAASCAGVVRAGLSRNRGRGRVRISCLDENGRDVTKQWFDRWMGKGGEPIGHSASL